MFKNMLYVFGVVIFGCGMSLLGVITWLWYTGLLVF